MFFFVNFGLVDGAVNILICKWFGEAKGVGLIVLCCKLLVSLAILVHRCSCLVTTNTIEFKVLPPYFPKVSLVCFYWSG